MDDRPMGIFVETVIRAPMDSLWAHTQTPDIHQRWDLRFTSIDYLPRPAADAPQPFRYATRIGFGIEVAGFGETVADRSLVDGTRVSSLRFGSDDPLALIREGSGFWKYVPTADGVRFTTWYDYRTRHGTLGRLVDRTVFRPLMGWATAWSFDRLRLWLERGIPPAASARAAAVHALARSTLALIFVWHGLVPKLLGPHPDELAMFAGLGVTGELAASIVAVLGVAEVGFGGALLVLWHRRWPSLVAALFVVATLIGVAATSPTYLTAPFTPVTLNLGVAALALIDLLALPDAPDAGRCRRQPSSPSETRR